MVSQIPWEYSSEIDSQCTKLQMVEEKIINQLDSHCLKSWMNRLLAQREKLLLFNQKYWGKLKRKEWLANGDQNSRFFNKEQTLGGKRNQCANSWTTMVFGLTTNKRSLRNSFQIILQDLNLVKGAAEILRT